jgi:ferredoxin-type protein NapH
MGKRVSYLRLRVDRETLFYPLLFLLVFYLIAIWRYLATGNTFYLWNFGYLGSALALGIFLAGALPGSKYRWGRCVTQFLMGSYLLVYVGVICREDMQIEGFWLYLSLGVFAGATLHYFIAKVLGTFFFNRGWCGWACWTAMILDLFPWAKPRREINRRWTKLRYVHFLVVLAGIALLIAFSDIRGRFRNGDVIEVYWLLMGNLSYYVIGYFLALFLKDNRAFCKYVCPIPVFQKVGARFALLKMEIDRDKCIDCDRCESNCPMQVKLLEYKNKGQRVLSTECILCQTCANVCPRNAIRSSFRIDGFGR